MLRYALVVLVVAVCMHTSFISFAGGQGHPWQPQPDRAAVMVISAHPDDEGIFFGGVLPYYTQVRRLPTVHISMTSGDFGRPPEVREEEMRNADWVYGLRNEPLFPRFKDEPTSTLDQTWDVWADGVIDGDDVQEGREAAARYVAEQIRMFRPAVIVSHDIDGEYGHNNHRASSLAVIDAWSLAADASEDISGLPAYQADKLYIHQSEANGLGTPGFEFENWLFHDYWEDTTIDTNGDGIPDSTPREVADLGLDEHISQGRPDVSTVYRNDDNFDGHHSEWWGLYESTVGPDTLVSSFEIEGATYIDWARGDFFENIDLSGFFDLPGPLGDVNLDGFVNGDGTGTFDDDDVAAFILGWGTTGHANTEIAWMNGDMNFDGRTDFADWSILRANHESPGNLDLVELLGGSQVPEPASVVLAVIVACAAVNTRRRRRYRARVWAQEQFHSRRS